MCAVHCRCQVTNGVCEHDVGLFVLAEANQIPAFVRPEFTSVEAADASPGDLGDGVIREDTM
jgi:hypothetical protein